MNNLSNTNMPPDDIIYSDYNTSLPDGKTSPECDVDDMIFSSLPEIKLHSDR